MAVAADPSPYPLPPLERPHRMIQALLGAASAPSTEERASTAEGAPPLPGHYDAEAVVITALYAPGVLDRLIADRQRDLAAHQITTVAQQRARERVALGRTVTPYVRVIVPIALDNEALPVEQLAEITRASEVSRALGVQVMASTSAPLASYASGFAHPVGRRGYLAAVARNFLAHEQVGSDTERQRQLAAL